MATEERVEFMPKTDLERAVKALKDKLTPYQIMFNYYDGDQPLVYVSSRLKEVFPKLDVNFQVNWSAVVIDSVSDRINLRGFQCPDKADAQVKLKDLWNRFNLYLESEDIHEAALITGEAYLMVWLEPNNPSVPEEGEHWEVYFQDPRMMHLFYKPSAPREKSFAAKWWHGSDNHVFVVLYYGATLQTFRSKKAVQTNSDIPYKTEQYELIEERTHEMGTVPVFHFRTSRRSAKSDIKDVIPLQDAANKLLIDMLVAAEFAAFRQKWVISNADITDLKNKPGGIMDIPAGDGQGQPHQVGEFSETPLGNYLTAIDSIGEYIASTTRTPKHFFFSGEGQAPSGEALIAMEAPLVKKAEKRIDFFTPVWKEFCAFILQYEGLDVQPWEIMPVFDDPRTIQPLTQAQVLQTRVSAGVPLVTALREDGKTQEELDQMEEDSKKQQKAQQSTLAAALLAAKQQETRGDELDADDTE